MSLLGREWKSVVLRRSLSSLSGGAGQPSEPGLTRHPGGSHPINLLSRRAQCQTALWHESQRVCHAPWTSRIVVVPGLASGVELPEEVMLGESRLHHSLLNEARGPQLHVINLFGIQSHAVIHDHDPTVRERALSQDVRRLVTGQCFAGNSLSAILIPRHFKIVQSEAVFNEVYCFREFLLRNLAVCKYFSRKARRIVSQQGCDFLSPRAGNGPWAVGSRVFPIGAPAENQCQHHNRDEFFLIRREDHPLALHYPSVRI